MEYLYLSRLPFSFKLDRLIVYVESEYAEEFNQAILHSYCRICDYCSLHSFRFVYVPLAEVSQEGYKRKLIARNYPMLGEEERRKLLVSWAQDGTEILTRKLLSCQTGDAEPVTHVSGFLCWSGTAMLDGRYMVDRFSYRELAPGQDVWLEIRHFVEELEAEQRHEDKIRRDEEEEVRRKISEEVRCAEAEKASALPEDKHLREKRSGWCHKKKTSRKQTWFEKPFYKLSNEIFSDDDMSGPEKPVHACGSGTSLPLNIVAETIKEGSELLVQNGYYDLLIDALGYDLIEEIAERIKRVELQRMVITDDYRILLGREQVEVRLSPLAKAFYFLYLRHPEGIAFKCLVDYKHELLEIYKLLTAKENFARIEESVSLLTDATNNSANEKCSRIRAAFLAALGKERIASFYYISGGKGEKRKITLDRSLVSGLEMLNLGIVEYMNTI